MGKQLPVTGFQFPVTGFQWPGWPRLPARRQGKADGLNLAAVRLAIAILLTLLGAAEAFAQGSTVRGVVRAEGSMSGLSAAVVEIRSSGYVGTTSSDSSGAYVVRGVAGGRQMVRAHRLGYAPLELEVVVPAGREMELDLVLRPDPVILDPISVDAGGPRSVTDTLAAPASELGLAGGRVMQSSPGFAELGLTDAAQGAPGQEPIDPSDVLYVRGTGTDLKLVYLDGAPVYAPFPLGGLVDPFSPDLLQSADVYLGGAPARFDGGLSYLLDLRTRGVRSGRAHSSGAMDLLAARAMAEVPLGSRAGILLAGRAVHDLGTRQISSNPLPYAYEEGLARLDLRVGETGLVSLMGFGNAEEVWLGGSNARDSTIHWGNTALSLRYRGTVRGTSAELTAALGTFGARLPLVGSRIALVDGWSDRTRFAADFSRRMGDVSLNYGASFDRQEQGYDRHDASGIESVGASGETAGAYAEVGLQLSQRVRVRGGLRADAFTPYGEFALSPRLSATWLATERATLTLAAGRYHQFVRLAETSLLERDFGAATGAAPDTLAVGSASHLALSFAQEVGDGMRLGLEGFFKGFEGIPGGDAAAANASGVDIWLRRDEGRWTGWAGYSLAWVWSLPDTSSNSRFAGRHLLTTGLGIPIGDDGKVDVVFAYGAGLPYSTIPLAETAMTPGGVATLDNRPQSAAGAAPLLPEPTRPYLRLDLSAAKSWDTRWGGTEMTLTPYIRLLNSLGHRDALFYRYERDRDEELRPLVVLPVVPVLGLEWRM